MNSNFLMFSKYKRPKVFKVETTQKLKIFQNRVIQISKIAKFLYISKKIKFKLKKKIDFLIFKIFQNISIF